MSTYSNNLIKAADSLKKLYSNSNTHSDLFTSKNNVMSKFQVKFSHNNLSTLPIEEFYEFLHFRNNHHWTQLDRQIKNLKTNEEKLRTALLTLTDTSLDIADRIDSMPKVKGLDYGIYTPFLLVSSSLKYGVWNSKSEKFLEKYDLLPQVKKEPRGRFYRDFNNTLNELAKEVGIDLWVLDGLFHYDLFEYTIPQEFERRKKLWDELKIKSDNLVLYNELRSNGIVRTQRGIYAPTLKGLGERVAKTLLSTGTVYKDQTDEEYLVYDFPDTKNKKTDENEINSMWSSRDYGLPLFVVFGNKLKGKERQIMIGIVTAIDEECKTFLVKLYKKFPTNISEIREHVFKEPLEPFQLYEKGKPGTKTMVPTRPKQGKFHFDVISLYGLECAVCGIKHKPIIEAAHILPKANHGSDHPENGIPLCANHHELFDNHWFTIDTNMQVIVAGGRKLSELQIKYPDIKRLRHLPHVKALAERFSMFEKKNKNT